MPPKKGGVQKKTKQPKRQPKKQPTPKEPLSKSPAQICWERGPNGKPVYDEAGFELDYETVLKVTTVAKRKNRGSKKYMAMLEKDRTESARKCEIMGSISEKVSAVSHLAWRDRVSRDLDIPYHKVTMDDYEEWHKQGNRGKPGEFEAENILAAEKARVSKLATGAAFRK